MNSLKSVFLTNKGKVRTHNEDHGGIYEKNDGLTLAIVCDGMGGHQAGDIASKLAVEKMEAYWNEEEVFSSPNDTETWLKNKIVQVNSDLYQYASEHTECNGMGTTIVAAVCTSSYVTIGHVGDSRCYLSSEEQIKQLTDDHSFVNELVKSGQISKEDAEHHPRKNVILQALGTEQSVKVDIRTLPLEEDGYLLLCSDGLTNKVSDEELISILHNSEMLLQEKAEQMINLANEYGGEDNISVAIVNLSVTEMESR